MRLGKVVGRVCLSQSYDTLVGGRFLIVEVQDRFGLSGQPRKTTESLVVYDHLGATDGDLIAFHGKPRGDDALLPGKNASRSTRTTPRFSTTQR
jgi:microcompartment protein CcmK/EutM